MTYRTAVLKQSIEFVLIFPIVLVGKLAGKLFPLKPEHNIFLFFPSADIGGSVKVNADITEGIKERKPLIIFSKKPKNNKFLPLFRDQGVRYIDLSPKIDNKLFHFVNIFYRGVLASWINAVPKPVVFGGESLYFYKVIPHLKDSTKIIELCHLNTWFNYSQAFISKIDVRVFSTLKIKRDVEKQYKENNIANRFYERLQFIDNSIDIPTYKEINNDILQVLYVGRGAPQKRVHLLVQIAEKAKQLGLPVHFTFVGDVGDYFTDETRQFCSLLGQIQDKNELNDIYLRSDVLILTSKYEGLPLVVMDMMARGKVILSTAVDGIPDYITHQQNGLLITETDETKIVDSAIQMLELLIKQPELKIKIGKEAYNYAQQKFSRFHFDEFYSSLLTSR